jgi:acyl-CoA thioesterase II
VTGAASPRGLEATTALAGEDGAYSVALSGDWEIWGPNGGYLAAIALRAAGRVAEIPRPVSFYCHFLSSPAFAEVELSVATLKRGRSTESLAVQMTQEGRPVLSALVRTAAEGEGHEHQEAPPPAVAPLEDSEPIRRIKDGKLLFPYWGNFSCRRAESVEGGAEEPEGRAAIREWVRFEPVASFADPFLEAARPLVLLDTYGWPAAWQRYGEKTRVAPNLDTAAWFHHADPDSEWLLIDEECHRAGDGLLAVAGRVWSQSGRLLASGGAQLKVA